MKKIFLYQNYNTSNSSPNKYVFTNLNNQAESHDTKGFRQFKKTRKAIAERKLSKAIALLEASGIPRDKIPEMLALVQFQGFSNFQEVA